MVTTRPNIILITTDQQRFDAMRLNDPSTGLMTPTMDMLASKGVNFTRAYTTCPVCIPARRTLLTGLHPHTHGLRGYRDGLDWDPPFTLPGLLGQAGYQTELIGKLHLHPQRKRYGFDHMVRVDSPNNRWDSPLQATNDWIDWLSEHGVTTHPNNIGINGNGRNARPWDMEERYHLTSWQTDQAVDFVTKYRDPSCPFFLHLSYWAPHPPMIPPQAYWDRYIHKHTFMPTMSEWTPSFDHPGYGVPDDSTRGPFPPEEIHAAAAGYYGLINHIDDRIRYFLTRLFDYGTERRHDPTYILFTSDHGEMLGDHQLWRKSLPYEASAHIPFFISGYNVDISPGTSDALVSLEDVCATALEMAGQPVPEALCPSIESKSLLATLQDDSRHVRDAIFGECTGYNNQYIVKDQYKYVWYANTNEEQVFDLINDPKEVNDISGQVDCLNEFRKMLEQHLSTRDDYEYDIAQLTPLENKPPKAIWGDNLN